MTTRRTVVTAMAGAMMLSGTAFAQSAADTAAAGDQGQTLVMHRRQPPSPETIQHLLDGRLAMIKTALQLTPEQEKLWAPVEQAMRDNAAARTKVMGELHDARVQAGPGGWMDPIARLEFVSKSATERATGAQKLADALRPLYATFTDGQKSVAMVFLEQAGDRRQGRGGAHVMRE